MAKAKEGDQSVTSDDAPDTAASQVTDKTAPGYQLVPGDVGYAPPARIAIAAGIVPTAEQLGHILGAANVNITGAVPLAMPPPAPATVSSDIAFMKPSAMSRGQVAAQLRKTIGDVTAWIMDIPYPMDGKEGVVVQFFRDLEARQRMRGTAATLGRVLEPDQVDKTTTIPPAEFFQLRHAAQLMVAMQAIYEDALTVAGGQLSAANKTAIDQILAEFTPLAAGPTEPPPAVNEDVPPNEPAVPLTRAEQKAQDKQDKADAAEAAAA